MYVCVLPVMHISMTCDTTTECERSSLKHVTCRNHMILQVKFYQETRQSDTGISLSRDWQEANHGDPLTLINIMCTFQGPARRRPSMVLPWRPCSRFWGWGRVRPRNSCRWRRDSKSEPRPYGGEWDLIWQGKELWTSSRVNPDSENS